jgi:hypothetical protein
MFARAANCSPTGGNSSPAGRSRAALGHIQDPDGNDTHQFRNLTVSELAGISLRQDEVTA